MDMIPPQRDPWLNWEFTPIESFLKFDLAIKLDPDDSICPAHLQRPDGCPNGPRCLYRHVTPAPTNFPAVPLHLQTLASGRPRERSTVCKHYLRGLCKKGDVCEFLHELDVKRMPECWWYNKYGLCINGDDCMYLHLNYPHHAKNPKILAIEGLKECHAYTKGFCPEGPHCPRRHIRRKACLPYLIGGFCPQGPECNLAHPLFESRQEIEPDGLIHRPLAGGPEGDRFGGRPRGDELGSGLYTGSLNRRPLADVTCNKCGERGHYANHCPQRRP